MKALKIRNIGSSAGVILPKSVLERMGTTVGEELNLVETSNGILLTPYDAEFIKQMEVGEEIAKADRDVLKALAK